MPLTDQTRILNDRLSPRIVLLWRALLRLRRTVSFMNSGAHPDDETTGMLAALGWRDGIDLSFACANRGEGGQNDIGTERTAALGTLRTAEMEQASRILGMRLYWLSTAPDDPIFDFGFSKSGEETLAHWGRERTLARLTNIVRTERPDILCPTFLDVPGQHGHHRAMTEMAHAVFERAADPAYTGCDLEPWQIGKLYLPAWSGAGQSYDDDLPPPPATLTIEASGRDPVTGWPYARIAQHSRAMHLTQGMGRWVPPGEERDWPLHLAASTVSGPDKVITSGLPATLADLDLPDAQAQIDAALAAFPDSAAILRHATEAHRLLGKAFSETAPNDAHRLTRKLTQLTHVIRLASGVEAQARTDEDHLSPGEQTALTLRHHAGEAETVTLTPSLLSGWSHEDRALTISSDAAPSDPYPDSYDPERPPAPNLRIRVTAHGHTTQSQIPFERTPLILPARSAQLATEADILNLQTSRRSTDIAISDKRPAAAKVALDAPDGWQVAQTQTGVTLTAPNTPQHGLYTATLTLDGQPASTVRTIAYDHIAPRLLSAPATIRICVLDATLPKTRIGYIGGGADKVSHWLSRMAANVTDLTDADLGSDAALAEYDTLVIGIFALRARAGLTAQMPRLHRWTETGGTLLTLYHRPWDNWDPQSIPPKPLEIGQPSLRWRVTDAEAEVTHLVPDHPLLTTPNRIGPDDWSGWHKERGLYFAKSWDAAYTPLLSMADPNEPPQTGALLTAEIGAGRYTHTSLILHHQMEQLVPGAFRLMANLLATRT
ncbi:PIG-L family deacetylase [Aestuariibius insulae]|uniref:PIG-L family deacetylase n=1 Tax=Aestuariibius insulae TaxID=2058287 RepID=UPI00345EE10A